MTGSRSAYQAAYGAAHKEEKRVYMAEYRAAHKEEIRAYDDAHKEEKRAYNAAHKDEIAAYQVCYRESHKEELAAYIALHREEARQEYAEFKEWLQILRTNNGCTDCETHEGKLLHHHLDPTTKRYNVSDMHRHSLNALEDELEKCVVLCKPCHTERHRAEGRL